VVNTTPTSRLFATGFKNAWSSDDLDWKSARTNGPLADWSIVPITSTAYWETLPFDKRVMVNRGVVQWRIELFKYGEALTVRVCKALLERMHGEVERQYLEQQLEEEVRHVRVFELYLRSTFGERERLSRNKGLEELAALLLCRTDKWYCKLLGMNILEAIAHAAFANLSDVASDPLLKNVLGRVRGDESRHVAFGRLSLRNVVPDLSASERENLRVFAKEAILLARGRHFPLGVYESLGEHAPSSAELREIEAAYGAGMQRAAFQERLMKGVRGTMEPLGLL
jgi:rubrerythrin